MTISDWIAVGGLALTMLGSVSAVFANIYRKIIRMQERTLAIEKKMLDLESSLVKVQADVSQSLKDMDSRLEVIQVLTARTASTLEAIEKYILKQ